MRDSRLSLLPLQRGDALVGADDDNADVDDDGFVEESGKGMRLGGRLRGDGFTASTVEMIAAAGFELFTADEVEPVV